MLELLVDWPAAAERFVKVMAMRYAAMGHSLLVWAIGEGRDLARAIDIHLQGESALPPSLRSRNRPLRADGWPSLKGAS